MGGDSLVIVGVDGSAPSRAALDFALAEAARRHAQLRVVMAYHAPDYWPVAYGMASAMIVPPSDEQLAEWAEQDARQVLDEALEAAGDAAAGVVVELRVVNGTPAEVLLDQSAGADLLVVGHRGRGAFASACLGSVGLRCVLHAGCPVVVVRPGGAPAAAERPQTVATAVR